MAFLPESSGIPWPFRNRYVKTCLHRRSYKRNRVCPQSVSCRGTGKPGRLPERFEAGLLCLSCVPDWFGIGSTPAKEVSEPLCLMRRTSPISSHELRPHRWPHAIHAHDHRVLGQLLSPTAHLCTQNFHSLGYRIELVDCLWKWHCNTLALSQEGYRYHCCKAGAKITLDCTVLKGHTSIDESMLTGESMPVDKKAEDPDYAASLNKTGTVQFKV